MLTTAKSTPYFVRLDTAPSMRMVHSAGVRTRTIMSGCHMSNRTWRPEPGSVAMDLLLMTIRHDHKFHLQGSSCQVVRMALGGCVSMSKRMLERKHFEQIRESARCQHCMKSISHS